MSDKKTATEEQAQRGTCAFCGQSRFIDTVGELTQAELDAKATELCTCPEADQARRKKERIDKINDFVESNFKSKQLKADIHEAIGKIWDPEHKRDFTLQSITMQPSEDETIKIWKDAEGYLRIKAKTVDNCELKV